MQLTAYLPLTWITIVTDSFSCPDLKVILESATFGEHYNLYNMRDFVLSESMVLNYNDQFKNLTFNASARDEIIILNHADGDYSSGSCTITVKRDVGGYVLDSFERTYEDSYIKVYCGQSNKSCMVKAHHLWSRDKGIWVIRGNNYTLFKKTSQLTDYYSVCCEVCGPDENRTHI